MFDKKKMKKKGNEMEMADMPEMEPAAKEAKLGVLKHLSDMAAEAMTNKLGKGMKKVPVASDSKEGLKAGLDKAEELVEKGDDVSPHASEIDGEDETMDEMKEDLMDQGGYEDLSAEEIDKKLAKLMELKKKVESKV